MTTPTALELIDTATNLDRLLYEDDGLINLYLADDRLVDATNERVSRPLIPTEVQQVREIVNNALGLTDRDDEGEAVNAELAKLEHYY